MAGLFTDADKKKLASLICKAECSHCKLVFTLGKEIGAWNCLIHPCPYDERLQCWPCCGKSFDAKSPHYTSLETERRGCTRQDHTILPRNLHTGDDFIVPKKMVDPDIFTPHEYTSKLVGSSYRVRRFDLIDSTNRVNYGRKSSPEERETMPLFPELRKRKRSSPKVDKEEELDAFVSEGLIIDPESKHALPKRQIEMSELVKLRKSTKIDTFSAILLNEQSGAL